jgi:hypothetical protein
MKHWHWISLAFLAFILAAAVMTVPRLGGGPSGEPAHADVITATLGGSGPYAAIDADVTNGMCHTATGTDDSIDATANVTVGDTHDIAVCFGNFPAPIQPPDPNHNGVAVISMSVHYNANLNSCVDKACGMASPCTEDDMPDLNEGTTLGQGSPTSPDMGGGWSCNASGFTEPSCAGGVATLDCGTLSGPFPPTGPGIAFPFFVVTFHAEAGGVDVLSLSNGAVNDHTSASLGSCNPPGQGEPVLPCIGAEVNKEGEPPAPTATPTATATATATATPCPEGGCPTGTPTPKAWTKTPTPPPTGTPAPAEPSGPSEPPPPPPPPPSGGTMPQVVPPATGSGPDGIPWASTAVWLLAAAGAVSVSLGGVCLRRAGHR